VNNAASLNRLFYLLIVFFIFLADQISKWVVCQHLDYYQPVTLLPFFSLYLTHNSGAAFSFLSNGTGWQRWFFIAVGLVISTAIGMWLYRLPKKHFLTGIALSLILGGALGNLWDRVFTGYVVDFLLLHWHQYEWPVFNLADTAISIGAGVLFFQAFQKRDK
jgi:signal peptidase II